MPWVLGLVLKRGPILKCALTLRCFLTLRCALTLAGALALAGGLSGLAVGQTAAPRMVSDAEAPVWVAVGRLNVAGNRSCTATLISDHEAITAAHCLFHCVTHHRADPKDIRLALGRRHDSYVAVRGVLDAAILPGYVATGLTADLPMIAQDIALLVPDQPFTPAEAHPLPVAVAVADGRLVRRWSGEYRGLWPRLALHGGNPRRLRLPYHPGWGGLGRLRRGAGALGNACDFGGCGGSTAASGGGCVGV